MTDTYAKVDDYLEGLFGEPDAALTDALQRGKDAGLPQIQVSPGLGRFLHVLALACRARSILEIGTLGGYSTIWLARALPGDGQLITLESEPKHAETAKRNIDAAGLSDRVEVHVGRGLDSLEALANEGAGPFDMVFIDADKETYPDYLEASLRLSRPGTLIVADNVVRGGAVAEGPSNDPRITGSQRFNVNVASDQRLVASFVQTVGAKGHDGMALAVVRRV